MPRLRRALGPLPFFESRQLRPQCSVLFHQPVRLRLQFLEIGARLLQHLLFHRSCRFAFIQQLLIALLLLTRPAALLPQALQFQPRHRQSRLRPREFLRQLPMLVIQRQRLFLLGLLQTPQAFQIFAEPSDLALQMLQRRCRCVHRALLHLHFAGQLAQLALQRQRTAARLLAAAHRVPVIADAIRQQEEKFRMLGRQLLRRRAILCQKTMRQPRQ